MPKYLCSGTYEVLDLQSLLDAREEIVVVAGPSQQLHNLAIATTNKTKKETPQRTQAYWFDLVVIDEASQLDVATSTLVVSKADEEASFVLAGDDKQLPPIHQATPPQDLDHVVGSVYSYIRSHHGVEPEPLQVNYRSCQTLVDFTRRAGYDPGLYAHHPDLRVALLDEGCRPSNRKRGPMRSTGRRTGHVCSTRQSLLPALSTRTRWPARPTASRPTL